MDVEPMGDEYVTGMCHDIEDPTFDATAVATNPHAQVRPIHRPPRTPAGRSPHCAWTVKIDPSYPPVSESEGCVALQSSRAALTVLDEIDGADDGQADYSGDLMADFDFASFSHSALVRMADEVCLQMQLLNLGFLRAVQARTDAAAAEEIATKQLVGIAGVAAERIRNALDLPADEAGALRVLELHPLLNPAAYVTATVGEGVQVEHGPAHDDNGWITLVGPDRLSPLQAAVRAVDPHLDVEVTGSADSWTAYVERRSEPATEAGEVAVTRFSTGTSFIFQPRKSIPITVL